MFKQNPNIPSLPGPTFHQNQKESEKMGGFSVIEYLKDPHLVARFQRYFGVKVPNNYPNFSSDLKNQSNNFKKCKNTTTDCDFEFDLNEEGSSSSGRKEEKNSISLKSRCDNGPLGSSEGDNKSPKDLVEKLRKRVSSSSSVTTSHHVRNESSGSSSSSSGVSSGEEEESDGVTKFVGNKFWYYLFVFGTALGDEAFYACWFSFWFWNVDGAVGRRVVLLWAILMYIGQGLKDIIRWPRPSCPPVIRLQKKWELEYGMPSTHAVVGAAVPFSTIIFTASRYQYPIEIGVAVAFLWCTLVCTSRIYLGMHSVLDVVAGLSLVAVLFVPCIPLVDWLDPIILKSEYGGLGIFLVGVVLCFCTPGGDRWTPARGDTFVILGSCVGLTMGAWLNYQLGVIRGPPLDPPYAVIWPSYSMLGLSLLRLVIGLCMVVATRAIVKSVLHTTFHSVLKVPKLKDLNNANKKEVFAELSQKFLSYIAIGLTVVYLSPAIFRLIGIERPTFHTEV